MATTRRTRTSSRATKESIIVNNKFTNLLSQSDSEIKAQKAANMLSITQNSAKAVITKLEDRLNTIDRKLIILTDVAPNTTLTNMVVADDFDAESWFKEIVELETERAVAEEELNIALDVYDDWFEEDKEGEAEFGK